MALEPAKLADFKLAGALGSGTTSKVYEAVHIASGRPVAIKMLEPSQSGSEMRERFAREAVLLSSLVSRHVGNILGFGFERGQPFIVLERLEGETLDAKLRRDGPVPLERAVRWIEQLLVGVRDCHDKQIIHRDIKPANIFIAVEGFDDVVKLIDFGVARLREIAGDIGGLTSTNHLIGSMGYMAPEQFRNAKAVGFTADLYAVGVVIFRTLTGRLPFVSRSLEAVVRMKSEQAAPPISSMEGMPNNVLLDWYVTKTMARDPKDRFQSAREMLEHWWNVMASLDEDGATDVMRGIGRVDESYAGPLHRGMREASAPVTMADPAAAEPIPISVAFEDERTIQRRSPLAGGSVPSSIPVVLGAAGEELTSLDGVPLTVPNPSTQRGGEPEPATPREDFDMPTRHDPNLRKLVERELELHRKRKGGG